MCLCVSLLLIAGSSAYAKSLAPSSEFKSHCAANLKPTRITVRLVLEEAKVDNSKSIAELTGLSKRPEGMTLGLTQSSMSISAQWKNNSLINNRNQVACMRPDIEMRLSISPHTVYIGREFKPGTCGYAQVFDHEQAHVRVNKASLEKTVRWLNAELNRQFKNEIFYGNYETLRSQLTHALEVSWMDEALAVYRQANTAHAALDTPREYGKVQAACRGEIQRITNSQPKFFK